MSSRIIKTFQSQLRTKATPAEKRFRTILNDCCKAQRCSFVFQYIVEIKKEKRSFIADFCVPEYRTIFEIDGPYHDTEQQKSDDLFRDTLLKEKHYQIIRIKNYETHNREHCIEKIMSSFVGRKKIVNKNKKKKKETKNDKKVHTPRIIKEWLEGEVKIVEYSVPSESKRKKLKSNFKKKKCRMEAPGSFSGSIYWKS